MPISTLAITSVVKSSAIAKMSAPMTARIMTHASVMRGPKRSNANPNGICVAPKPIK